MIQFSGLHIRAASPKIKPYALAEDCLQMPLDRRLPRRGDDFRAGQVGNIDESTAFSPKVTIWAEPMLRLSFDSAEVRS